MRLLPPRASPKDATMSYEIISTGLSGFGAFGGPGDVLGEGCLCGGSGVCTNTKLQASALANLRAAMAAAGIPTRTGNWSTAEQNAMNAFASSHGQPVSNKFLVDGGPCRALKAALAAPAPTPAGTTTAGGVTCASLLSQAPPIPAGTPIDSVIAVLQQLAPPGFDVRACVTAPASGGGATTVPAIDPGAVTPGTTTTVVPGSSSTGTSPLLVLGLGLVAVLGIGGLAYMATKPKMRRNGHRSKGRVNLTRLATSIPDKDLRKVQSELDFWRSPRRHAMLLSGPNRAFPIVLVCGTYLTIEEADRLYPLVMRRLDSTGWNNYPGMRHSVSKPLSKNGKRRTGRKGMRKNGVLLSEAAKRGKNAYHAGYRAGTARAASFEEMIETFPHGSSTVSNAIQREGLAIAKRKPGLSDKERVSFANGFYFGVADAHGFG